MLLPRESSLNGLQIMMEPGLGFRVSDAKQPIVQEGFRGILIKTVSLS